MGHHCIDAISIHALLTESDRHMPSQTPAPAYFYPRSPYGERPGQLQQRTTHKDFYPRSPYGERRRLPSPGQAGEDFYPRSPYGERRACPLWTTALPRFLSTLSLRRATSICCAPGCITADFYPRSPYGERLPLECRPNDRNQFLSTLSLRRATNRLDRLRGDY